jgi:hypothetical protein
MWPLAPSTLQHRWSRGAEHQYGKLIVAKWDASVKGVSLAVADGPGKIIQLEGMRFEGVSTIVTFGNTLEEQVYREGPGAPMIMRLVRTMFDLRGRTVLLLNDCATVIMPKRRVPFLHSYKRRRRLCAKRRSRPTVVFLPSTYQGYSGGCGWRIQRGSCSVTRTCVFRVPMCDSGGIRGRALLGVDFGFVNGCERCNDSSLCVLDR